MIDGQSEQQIKKAMKIHEIVSSDKAELRQCKSELMTKLAMDSKEAQTIAESIRDMFMPMLLKKEGLEIEDMPEGFDVKMTDTDEDFEDETPNEDHEESDETEMDHEFDAHNDDNEVDDDEIATIHITVPADKIREVEQALETVLGDMDAESKDLATDHKEMKGENDMNKEARQALRKTILAAMADESEVSHVARKDGFEHDKSEQVFEEGEYNTMKGNIKDPDFSTLNFAENDIPTFTDLIGKIDGLTESLTETKFDGTPSDSGDFELDFNPLEIPSQGDEELYTDLAIPSEGKVPMKRVVNSSVLGEFDADAAEEALAFALKTAGVEDEDLGKLTYAEALELFKAIRTASEDREHYTKDGVMNFPQNQPKDPDKKAVTESALRDNSESEEDPESAHTRKGPKELYSSTDDQYAAMLRKLMKGASDKMDDEDKEADTTVEMPGGATVTESKHDKEDMAKEAELYKARLKTAYAMSTKLATAGILPTNEVDSYAEGMLNDGLTVPAMIRQTKLMLNTASANAEKLAASQNGVRTASTGISFNPSVRAASADLSGAMDIQNALRGLGWTSAKVDTGVEE